MCSSSIRERLNNIPEITLPLQLTVIMAYDVSDGNAINPQTHVCTHTEQVAAAAAIPSQFVSIKTKNWGYKVKELQNQTVWYRDQRLKEKTLFSKPPQVKERKCNDWLSSVRTGGRTGSVAQELDD